MSHEVSATQQVLLQYNMSPFKEARNSFVGRAQTGFQFSRETQKLKQTNKQKWRRALVWI